MVYLLLQVFGRLLVNMHGCLTVFNIYHNFLVMYRLNLHTSLLYGISFTDVQASTMSSNSVEN